MKNTHFRFNKIGNKNLIKHNTHTLIHLWNKSPHLITLNTLEFGLICEENLGKGELEVLGYGGEKEKNKVS